MDTLHRTEIRVTHPSMARPWESSSDVLMFEFAARRMCLLDFERSAVRLKHLLVLSDRRRADIRAKMDRDADAACRGFAVASRRIAEARICPFEQAREAEALKDALALKLEAIRNAGRAALEHEHAGFLSAIDALSSASAPKSWPSSPAWPVDR